MLMGVGSVFAPYITGLWVLLILVLVVVLIDGLFNKGQLAKKIPYLINGSLIFSTIFYTLLAILSFINPLVLWPVVISFLINALWSATMLYHNILIDRIVDK